MAIKPIFQTVKRLKAKLENLTIDDLKRELAAKKRQPLLVDIREIQEVIDLGTIPGAVHVPRGMLEFWADPASPYYRDMFTAEKRIVVFCAGGGRSAFAAKALTDMGFASVAHLEEGFSGWAKAGEPVQEMATRSRWMRKPDEKAPKAERPPVWFGHEHLAVMDIPRSTAFFVKLGLRLIGTFEKVAVLELRGGTHLILEPADNPTKRRAKAPFDLMVEDLDRTRADYVVAGLKPSVIADGKIHRSFTVTEPSGYAITVNSSHVSDLPV